MADRLQTLAEVLGVADPTVRESADNKGAKTELPAVQPMVGLTSEAFARGILETSTYRESLLRRILMDELPPAVEVWLLNSGYGKPKDASFGLGAIGNSEVEITEVRRVVIRPSHAQREEQEEAYEAAATPSEHVTTH